MNILLISYDYPPYNGGIAHLSYEIVKGMLTQDGKLIVIAPLLKGYKKFDKKTNFIIFRLINIKILREIALFFSMLYLILRFKINFIYNLTWYPSAAVSYFVSIFTGTSYAIHVHAADYFEDRRGIVGKLKYNFLRMRIKRLVFNRAKKIIAVSNFTKNRMIADRINASKIKVIFSGVDSRRFMPGLDARAIILKYKLAGKKVLLTVSRLQNYKGHDMVIKVLPKLRLKFPNIIYLIVGDGPYQKNLRQLVKELNLEECVIFTGTVEDRLVPLYYNACNIFIMLSREIKEEAKVEGFGLVFLEAGACAKPVIGGKSGGIEDAVIDEVTGLLADPLDLDEIYCAVEKILSDNDYADKLGANGLERIKREKLSWQNTAKKVYDILKSGLEE